MLCYNNSSTLHSSFSWGTLPLYVELLEPASWPRSRLWDYEIMTDHVSTTTAARTRNLRLIFLLHQKQLTTKTKYEQVPSRIILVFVYHAYILLDQWRPPWSGGICASQQYRHYTNYSAHYTLYTTLVNPICATRFHSTGTIIRMYMIAGNRHYDTQPAP